MVLLDFLEPGQTTNSDHYIVMLTKLQAREEDNLSPAIQ
jgi:hypothetical protein